VMSVGPFKSYAMGYVVAQPPNPRLHSEYDVTKSNCVSDPAWEITLCLTVLIGSGPAAANAKKSPNHRDAD
jgi:hypothetical protein